MALTNEERKMYTRKCPICGKSIKWIRGQKPEVCPFCQSIRWDMSKDECRLFNLQATYLKTRDRKILDKMSIILYPYAKKTILKMLGSCYYDADKLEDKVQGTVAYFMCYYVRKPTFYVSSKFGSLLYQTAQQQLYNQKQKNVDTKEFSYDKPIGNDKDGSETCLLNLIQEKKVPSNMETESMEKELATFLDKMYLAMVNAYGIKKAILGIKLLHFYIIHKKDTFFDSFYLQYGTEYKQILELEKLALYDFLRELKEINYQYYER